jgi:hypothetical protein
MTDKAQHNRNRKYDFYGDDLASIRLGFGDIAMAQDRREAAYEIVAEVVQANGANSFRWYKPSKDELACYWDHHETNVLWVSPSEVHTVNDASRIVLPLRPTDFVRRDGKEVGWLLPYVESGSGGGRQKSTVPTVLCPVTQLTIPANKVCNDCDVVHQP